MDSNQTKEKRVSLLGLRRVGGERRGKGWEGRTSSRMGERKAGRSLMGGKEVVGGEGGFELRARSVVRFRAGGKKSRGPSVTRLFFSLFSCSQVPSLGGRRSSQAPAARVKSFSSVLKYVLKNQLSQRSSSLPSRPLAFFVVSHRGSRLSFQEHHIPSKPKLPPPRILPTPLDHNLLPPEARVVHGHSSRLDDTQHSEVHRVFLYNKIKKEREKKG